MKFLSGALLLILLSLKVSGQQQKAETTRGDRLAAKLQEAEPRLQKEFGKFKAQAEAIAAAAQYRLSWLLVYGTGTVDLKAVRPPNNRQQPAMGWAIRTLAKCRFGTGTEPTRKRATPHFAGGQIPARTRDRRQYRSHARTGHAALSRLGRFEAGSRQGLGTESSGRGRRCHCLGGRGRPALGRQRHAPPTLQGNPAVSRGPAQAHDQAEQTGVQLIAGNLLPLNG